MNTKIERWEERISEIKKELSELSAMRPGALSKQYNVCGKANCRCKDQNRPKRHGPYFQLSYSHAGKSTTEFVNREVVPDVRRQLRNYARFKKLTDEWVTLSVRIAKARKQQTAK